jgi:DUF438 domain-containing protein
VNPLAKEPTPVYEVDDETRELLEACLNMVAQASSMQVTEEGAEGLIQIADAVAERFNIASHDITVEEADSREEPKVITVYTSDKPRNSKPKLTAIDGGKLTQDPPDDDDTRH